MGRKKPFINKKKADTFQLINRSTSAPQDPNAAPVFLQHGLPKDITKKNSKTGRFEDDEENDEFLPQDKRRNDDRSKRNNGKDEDFSDDDGREYDEDEDFDEEIFGGGGSKKPTKYRDNDFEFGEYGFPDDGYDYTKHFKPTGGGGVYIPSNVFDKPDLLSKAQKESERLLERIDPEILAALNDDAEEIEEELPENFLELAGGVEGDPEEREDHVFGSFRSKRKRAQMASMYLDYEDGEEYDDDDDDEEFDDEDYDEDDRGGKRVAPQNFMEEKFEVIEKQYDDDEVGELDEDDPSVRGLADISDFRDILTQHLSTMNVGKKKRPQPTPAPKTAAAKPPAPASSRKEQKNDDEHEEDDEEFDDEEVDDDDTKAQENKPKQKYIYAKNEEEEDPEFEKAWKQRVLKMVEEESAKEAEKGENSDEEDVDDKIFESWYTESKRIDDDCESVLSTYTNTENHPKLLSEPKGAPKKIKISSKTGMPIGVLPTRKKAVEQPPTDEQKKENLGKARAKETPEEKRARKKAIKAERKDNRERKKQLKSQFQKEELRQKGLMSTNRVQPAVVF